MNRYIIVVVIMIASFACTNKVDHKIAVIPEASGIAYCANSDTLVVVNDEGWYYELSRDGDLLYKNRAKKYDLEGVVCEDDSFLFAVEDKGLLRVDRKNAKMQMISIDEQYHNKKIDIFEKKSGIEGITKINNLYYLSKQSKKKKDSLLYVVELEKKRGKVVDIIKHNIIDSAGLDYYNNSLYIVSDKKDQLIQYDIKRKKIIKEIGLSHYAQEGIAFDRKGFVYIADDNGAVLKYTEDELGI